MDELVDRVVGMSVNASQHQSLDRRRSYFVGTIEKNASSIDLLLSTSQILRGRLGVVVVYQSPGLSCSVLLGSRRAVLVPVSI